MHLMPSDQRYRREQVTSMRWYLLCTWPTHLVGPL